MKLNRKCSLGLLTALMVLCFSQSAYAYFDPGTGSMLLQILGVAFVSLGAAFFAFKNKILAFFGKKSKSNDEEDILDDQDEA